MNIMWIEYKQDISKELDRTTWVEMMRELLNLDHNVKLILPSYGLKEQFGLGNNIIYLPTIKGKIIQSLLFSFNLFFYTIFYLIKENPDVILFGFLGFIPLLPFIVLSKFRLIKTRFVLDVRAVPADFRNIVDNAKDLLYKIVILSSKKMIDGITVISVAMKNQFISDYGIHPSKIGIWSSGVSKIFLLAKEENLKTPKSLNWGDERFVIMYHGIITSMRGLQETLKAVELAKDYIPNILFFILGDGKFRSELEDLVQEMKLEKHVIIHDPVKYELLPNYIAKCDIGILPFPDISWWNTSSPLKLMEYLASAKPVLVTEIEAHREVLEKENCCFFIKSNEPHEIFKGIMNVYNDQSQLDSMGTTGRNLINLKYTWTMQAQSLTDYLGSIIAN